ncbi:MAG: recombinase family protein [Burkholderiales bacterium]|nr:recombinase family protein [Burkholderiales bacterium]
MRKMPRLIGYARVSTQEQDLNLQLDALEKAGCSKDKIFVDKISGSKAERPGLEKCLAVIQPGDTLLVWRLDRLGRSMVHLISLIEDLRTKQIGFKSICDGAIDTTTASGELIFNIFSSLAQFERRLIQERTKAGLDAARARGRQGGRKKVEATNPKVMMAKNMHKDHGMSIDNICKTLKISRASFYRYLSL